MNASLTFRVDLDVSSEMWVDQNRFTFLWWWNTDTIKNISTILWIMSHINVSTIMTRIMIIITMINISSSTTSTISVIPSELSISVIILIYIRIKRNFF